MAGHSYDADAFVQRLYQLLLQREADAGGLSEFTARLDAGQPPAAVVEAFLDSDEFKNRRFAALWQDATSHYLLDLSASDEQLRRLWNTTSRYWRKAGGEPEEVYFSVLADKRFQTEVTGDELETFYDTGKDFIDFVFREATALAPSLKPKRCLDYGAGVGRLLYNALARITEVYAVDFSEAHQWPLGAGPTSVWLWELKGRGRKRAAGLPVGERRRSGRGERAYHQ